MIRRRRGHGGSSATLPTSPVQVRPYWPVSSDERAGVQTGLLVTATSKRTPLAVGKLKAAVGSALPVGEVTLIATAAEVPVLPTPSVAIA